MNGLVPLDNPTLPRLQPDAVAAYDPTDGMMRLVRRPAPNIITVQIVNPVTAGIYHLSPPTEYSAEAFANDCAHLTVCLAQNPSFRATHLLMRQGDAQAVRIDKDRLVGFLELQQAAAEGQPAPAGRWDRINVDELLQAVNSKDEDQPKLIPIRWGRPLLRGGQG